MRGPCTPSTRLSSMSEVADGPDTNVSGRPSRDGLLEPRDRLWDDPDDLLVEHHADVQVGHERERAAALGGAAVEDEGAGLGDRDRAAGQGAVEPVELRRPEAAVLDQLDPVRAPFGRQAGRQPEPLDAVSAQIDATSAATPSAPVRWTVARYSATRSANRATIFSCERESAVR